MVLVSNEQFEQLSISNPSELWSIDGKEASRLVTNGQLEQLSISNPSELCSIDGYISEQWTTIKMKFFCFAECSYISLN